MGREAARYLGIEWNECLHCAGVLGSEIGRVLGGGVRAGSLVLLGGGPGLGKSTLLLQLAGLLAKAPPWPSTLPGLPAAADGRDSVLYVSGEESADQVADRAARLALDDAGKVNVLCASDMAVILEHLHAQRPKAAILDSVQTLCLSEVTGAVGSISQVRHAGRAAGSRMRREPCACKHTPLNASMPLQVRECAKALVAVCKQTLGIPIFLASHVTKGGDIAGPKTLEHIVDTTLYLEGEDGQAHRILRASKNRCAGALRRSPL